MKEYNLNDIDIQDEEKEVSPEKLLTDEVLTGLPANSPIPHNAEVEGDEFVQFPDDTTQRVEGKSHAQGGVKLNLPDGSKVLSDSLKLNADQAQRFKKQYGVDVSTKDTYSQALEKYIKSIGLKKLYDQQEDVFGQLKDVISNDKTDPNTLRINKEYLSKKIQNIENQKTDKETLKKAAFDRLFDMQEHVKSVSNKQGSYAYGGITEGNFEKLCKKHNLTKEQGYKLLRGEDYMADGGETGDPTSGTFKVRTTPTQFSDENQYQRTQQHATAGGFGKIDKDNIDNVIKAYIREFPDIAKDVFDAHFDENGDLQYNRNLNFSQKSDQVKAFQEKANARMTSSANVVISNPEVFGDQAVKDAKNFLNNETFKGGEKEIRGFDSKLGNFTSGRFNLGLDLVTPEELKSLSEKGITTLNQLKKAVDDGTVNDLSESSLSRVKQVQNLQKGTDSDFSLFDYTPQAEQQVIIPQKRETKPNNADPNKGISDKVQNLPTKTYPRMFYTPDQGSLPPDPLQAESLQQVQLGRIDPVKIGIDQNIQQTENANNFVANQLQNLPSGQRAAALANLAANSQQNINDAAVQTNRINAQNQSAADLFNVNQSDKDNLVNANNRLNYEGRTLIAQTKTREDLRNWLDRNQAVRLNNFQNQQKMNLLDSLFPDYNIDFMGSTINYQPSYNWQPINPNSANGAPKTQQQLNYELQQQQMNMQQQQADRMQLFNFLNNGQ